jgi:hypothetical protein
MLPSEADTVKCLHVLLMTLQTCASIVLDLVLCERRRILHGGGIR